MPDETRLPTAATLRRARDGAVRNVTEAAVLLAAPGGQLDELLEAAGRRRVRGRGPIRSARMSKRWWVHRGGGSTTPRSKPWETGRGVRYQVGGQIACPVTFRSAPTWSRTHDLLLASEQQWSRDGGETLGVRVWTLLHALEGDRMPEVRWGHG